MLVNGLDINMLDASNYGLPPKHAIDQVGEYHKIREVSFSAVIKLVSV